MQKSKKLMSLLLAVLLVFPTLSVSAFAVDEANDAKVIEFYTCNNSSKKCDFSWVLYDNGVLEVNGTGNVSDHIINPDNASVVKEVVISDTITVLDERCFFYLSNVKKFSVSDNSTAYSVQDGILYDKEMTKLICCPQGKTDDTVVIPETVIDIGKNSFYNSQISYITIPGTVKYIESEAFSYSKKLKSVNFENGKRNLSIALFAFSYCDSLDNIVLYGNRVYALSSYSLYKTAYWNNTANWDNGVLYLNDILLATNLYDYDIPNEYEIKDGTTTIADRAMFYNLNGDASVNRTIKVIFPESVDNIGFFSVLEYDKLPEHIFRIGTENYNGLGYNSEAIKVYEEYIKQIEEIVSKYGKDLTADFYKELTEKNLDYMIYSHLNWLQVLQPLIITNDLLKIDNGIIGIADDNSWHVDLWGGPTTANSISLFYDGLILPESFQVLSGFTFLNDTLVKFLKHYFDDEIDEKDTSEKSVTFLNPDCFIYDEPETIWEGYTICGYIGSTAEEYAIKYNRKFVDIGTCVHSEICLQSYFPATCNTEGYSGDVYCQYCGEFIENGKTLPKNDKHTYGEEKITYATCTKDGTSTRICEVCGHKDVVVTEKALGHNFIYRTYIKPATCTEDGYSEYRCQFCSETSITIIPATGHNDTDNDGYCNSCGEKLSKNCSCMCHKTGFMGFIYKIARFFWKLFKTHKVCDCGIAHY